MTRALFIILFAFMALQPARAADVCDGLDGAAAEGCMDIVKQHGTIGKQFLACLKQYGDDPRCSKFPEVDPKSGADAYCHALKLDGESYQSCLEHPELWTWGPEHSPYAEKDYIWDCASYRWKWEDRSFGRRQGYKTLADACVKRTCGGNPSMCADGNLGYVPRKLRQQQQQQLRDLGRVPRERYVKIKKAGE
jgi:hypothetical protein